MGGYCFPVISILAETKLISGIRIVQRQNLRCTFGHIIRLCGSALYVNTYDIMPRPRWHPGYIDMSEHGLKLIQLVRENRILYDPNAKGYHDRPLLAKTWRTIGQKLNLPEDRCRQHWTNLRDAFRKFLRQKKYSSGGEDPTTAKRSYRYEREMQFLVPFWKFKEDSVLLEKQLPGENINFDELASDSNSQRSFDFDDSLDRKATNFDKDPANFESDYLEDDKSQIWEEIGNSEQLLQQNESQPTTSNTENPPTDTGSEFGADEVDYSYIIQEFNQTNNNTSQKSSRSRKPADEIETFFYSLAQTVKRLNPYHRALAKAEVCAVVTKLELEHLKNPNPDLSKIGDRCHDVPVTLGSLSGSSS